MQPFGSGFFHAHNPFESHGIACLKGFFLADELYSILWMYHTWYRASEEHLDCFEFDATKPIFFLSEDILGSFCIM